MPTNRTIVVHQAKHIRDKLLHFPAPRCPKWFKTPSKWEEKYYERLKNFNADSGGWFDRFKKRYNLRYRISNRITKLNFERMRKELALYY